MARRRLISPEFFQHRGLFEAEAKSGLPLRVAFAGLWGHTDRRGLFEWDPDRLKLAVLPWDTGVEFAAVLAALEAYGFVRSYVVAGRRYGVVPSFSRWQTFNKNERAAERIPSPSQDQVLPEPASPGQGASTVLVPPQHHTNMPGTGTGTGSPSDAPPVAPVARQGVLALPKPSAKKGEPAPWMGLLNAVHVEQRGKGSKLPAGAATSLRSVVEEFGADEVAVRYRRYCGSTSAQYHSVPKFVETFGSWVADSAERRPARVLALMRTAKMVPYNCGPDAYRLRRDAVISELRPPEAAWIGPALERINPCDIDRELSKGAERAALEVIARALEPDPAAEVA